MAQVVALRPGDPVFSDELPRVCSICLGPRDFQRLVRDRSGGECRLCGRAFVTFRWKSSGPVGTGHHTVICRNCSEERNACQSCVLDIEHHIALSIRDAALRILVEEGGTADDTAAVLAAVAAEYGADTTTPAGASRGSSELYDLEDVVRKFPFPVAGGTPVRPDGCRELCIIGIESDLSADLVRAHFRAPIQRMEWVPIGRYAFIEFTSVEDAPQVSSACVVLDGRRLIMNWGPRVRVPHHLRHPVGAVVRAYLQSIP